MTPRTLAMCRDAPTVHTQNHADSAFSVLRMGFSDVSSLSD
jgi:hypothetical protein